MKMKKISSLENELSDVNKTYIDIDNGQKFEIFVYETGIQLS